MPAQFDVSRWEETPKADDPTQASQIFIGGTISDAEAAGTETCYAEFIVSEKLLESFPPDPAAKRLAINKWLEEKVNERHFSWIRELETRPPRPVSVPMEVVATIIGDPRDSKPQLTIEQTHIDAGTEPESARPAAPANAPLASSLAFADNKAQADESGGAASKGTGATSRTLAQEEEEPTSGQTTKQ